MEVLYAFQWSSARDGSDCSSWLEGGCVLEELALAGKSWLGLGSSRLEGVRAGSSRGAIWHLDI